MRYVLPFALVIFVFAGSILCNRVQPLVLGLPMFVAWNIVSIFIISGGMYLIFRLDPANKGDGPDED